MKTQVGLFRLSCVVAVAGCLAAAIAPARAEEPWLELAGGSGPGQGKHIVLVSGDEEYRSEQGLTQLAKILATRHGFTCTVLYAIDPKDGTINPLVKDNIPGTELLGKADLLIISTRYRDLPDAQMKPFADYLAAGKPVIGLRTATHAFDIPDGKPYARFGCNSKAGDGGFGRQVLGEKWIDHHGAHGKESTRGLIAPGRESSPILRGIGSGEIWCPTDVYEVRLPLPGDSEPLVLGQVVAGMKPDDAAVAGKKNEPMMPVAWTKTYTYENGPKGRVFTTTMGAAVDLENEALRRLLVNASYWALGMEDRIPAKADVGIVGTYKPLPFGFGGNAKGQKPGDMR